MELAIGFSLLHVIFRCRFLLYDLNWFGIEFILDLFWFGLEPLWSKGRPEGARKARDRDSLYSRSDNMIMNFLYYCTCPCAAFSNTRVKLLRDDFLSQGEMIWSSTHIRPRRKPVFDEEMLIEDEARTVVLCEVEQQLVLYVLVVSTLKKARDLNRIPTFAFWNLDGPIMRSKSFTLKLRK